MTRLANRMDEAVIGLMNVFGTVAATIITYRNGAEVVTGLAATVDRTPFTVEEGGVLLTIEARHYMVRTSDLVDDNTGAAVVPASGGLITEDATGNIYQVAGAMPNNVYESIGPAGAVTKIHTKAANG